MQRNSIQREVSKKLRTSICEMPEAAICAGAREAKVRQLEERYPEIKAEKTASDSGTILAPVEQLDLATVIRVSEAVSGEIEHEKLIDTLMRTAIEHAGAERGLLILVRRRRAADRS